MFNAYFSHYTACSALLLLTLCIRATANAEPPPDWRHVAFEGETLIQVLGEDFVVQVDHRGCPWAITADLLSRYWIPSAAS